MGHNPSGDSILECSLSDTTSISVSWGSALGALSCRFLSGVKRRKARD
jgi:hypothetical protein